MYPSALSMADADVTALHSDSTQCNEASSYGTHLSSVALKAFQLGMSKISQY